MEGARMVDEVKPERCAACRRKIVWRKLGKRPVPERVYRLPAGEAVVLCGREACDRAFERREVV